MNCEFLNCKVTFIENDGLEGATLWQQLGYMANEDRMNVGNDIFYYGINRCDFPELFEAVLNDREYRGFALSNVVVSEKWIGFVLKQKDDGKEVRVDIALKGTSGKIQINKGECKFAIIEWTNGMLGDVFNTMAFGQIKTIQIED